MSNEQEHPPKLKNIKMNCCKKSTQELTLAMLKEGNLAKAFVRTSSFTSLPRSPQNKR